MRIRSLGREDPLEEGMATHSSILPWRTLMDREAGRLQPIGSQRVRCGGSDLACRHRGTSGAHVCVKLLSSV